MESIFLRPPSVTLCVTWRNRLCNQTNKTKQNINQDENQPWLWKKKKNLPLFFILKHESGERFLFLLGRRKKYIIHLVDEWKKRYEAKKKKIWCDNVFFIFGYGIHALFSFSMWMYVCVCVSFFFSGVVFISVTSHIWLRFMISECRLKFKHTQQWINFSFMVCWFFPFSKFLSLSLSLHLYVYTHLHLIYFFKYLIFT